MKKTLLITLLLFPAFAFVAWVISWSMLSQEIDALTAAKGSAIRSISSKGFKNHTLLESVHWMKQMKLERMYCQVVTHNQKVWEAEIVLTDPTGNHWKLSIEGFPEYDIDYQIGR